MSAAGPEPHDRHAVLRAKRVAGRDVVDACPVGDLDREAGGLVRRHGNQDAKRGFGARGFGDRQLPDGRRRAVGAGRGEDHGRREDCGDSGRRHDAYLVSCHRERPLAASSARAPLMMLRRP